MATAVSTSFYFIERGGILNKERPFSLLYDPPEDVLKTNTKLEKVENVPVHNFRDRERPLSLSENGFVMINIEACDLKPDEFDDLDKVSKHFLPKASAAVKATLGARRVQIYDSTVRKRHPDFPMHVGGSYDFLQPASIAHVDNTAADAEGLMRKLNPDEFDDLRKRKFQRFNIWMPIRGPLRDYPLALLDISTLDQERDLAVQDTVRRDVVHETYHVHYNPEQRWYFAKDQMPYEAWLFVQSTSGENAPPGVAHSSFDYPFRTETDVLRESIECRGFAFYDE